MAMHKIRDDNGVHYLDDKEYRSFKFKGCLKTVLGIILFLIVFAILSSI
jgi:hypothetical protein